MAHEEDASRRWISRAKLDALCGDRIEGFVLDGLWAAGALDALRAPCVAVVGTRAPSDAGRRRARAIAEELARAGICVVSGLALGIDAAAHEGALAAGAPTIGVLGGGHAHFFPPRNRELAARMALAGGSVVSPYAPDVVPQPWQFLARNAIIAALSHAVLVVEAAARSGALNTAGHAAERGVPVLAIPGDVDRPKAAGCNALIRDGATLVRDANDVLAALPAGVLPARPRPVRRRVPRTQTEGDGGGDRTDAQRVLAALGDGACDAGALADRLGIAPATLFPLLTELELRGVVQSGVAGYAVAREARY